MYPNTLKGLFITENVLSDFKQNKEEQKQKEAAKGLRKEEAAKKAEQVAVERSAAWEVVKEKVLAGQGSEGVSWGKGLSVSVLKLALGHVKSIKERAQIAKMKRAELLEGVSSAVLSGVVPEESEVPDEVLVEEDLQEESDLEVCSGEDDA